MSVFWYKVANAVTPNATPSQGNLNQQPTNVYPTSSLAVDNDRQWAERQAQKQMDYQERMSNTAYQRAISDLKAAGLNPALAYSQGGASAPTGSLANTGSTLQTAAVTRENNFFKLINTALAGSLKLANSALTSSFNPPAVVAATIPQRRRR